MIKLEWSDSAPHLFAFWPPGWFSLKRLPLSLFLHWPPCEIGKFKVGSDAGSRGAWGLGSLWAKLHATRAELRCVWGVESGADRIWSRMNPSYRECEYLMRIKLCLNPRAQYMSLCMQSCTWEWECMCWRKAERKGWGRECAATGHLGQGTSPDLWG